MSILSILVCCVFYYYISGKMGKERRYNDGDGVVDSTVIQEDIDVTVETIGNKKLGDFSKPFCNQLIEEFSLPPNSIKNGENLPLAELLDSTIRGKFKDHYLNLFSAETQKFLVDRLPNGAQGELSITVDDTVRNGVSSTQEISVTINGKDGEGEDFSTEFSYHSIKNLEHILKQLSEYHYLGLGLENGSLRKIVLTRPFYRPKEIKGVMKTVRVNEEIAYPQSKPSK